MLNHYENKMNKTNEIILRLTIMNKYYNKLKTIKKCEDGELGNIHLIL